MLESLKTFMVGLVLALSLVGCSKKTPTSSPTGTVLFQDNFDTQASMNNWHHTGDYRGGGRFQIVNGQFLRTDSGHVFYYNDGFTADVATYEFDVRGAWAFLWRGAYTDTNSGTVLQVQNNPLGSLKYSEIDWWGYDHGFHNGRFIRSNIVAIGNTLTDNFNHIMIVDRGDTVSIFINDQLKLKSSILSGYNKTGNIEIGANYWGNTTAYDNIKVSK